MAARIPSLREEAFERRAIRRLAHARVDPFLIVDTFDAAALKPKRASEPFKVVGNAVIWEVAQFPANYASEFKIESECHASAASASNAVAVAC